jgi:hypothetical protein
VAVSKKGAERKMTQDGHDMDIDIPPRQTRQHTTRGNDPLSNDTGPTNSHAASKSRRKAVSSTAVARNSSVVIDANGTVVIEDLDSPATRREKGLRRRAERLKQTSSSSVAGPPRSRVMRADKDVDVESALSSLSDGENRSDAEMQGVASELRQQRNSDGVVADSDADAEGEIDVDVEGEMDVDVGAGGNDSRERGAPQVEVEYVNDHATATTAVYVSRSRRKGRASQVLPVTPNTGNGTIVLSEGKSLEGGTLGTFTCHGLEKPLNLFI